MRFRHPPRYQGDTEWAICNTNGIYISEGETIVFEELLINKLIATFVV